MSDPDKKHNRFSETRYFINNFDSYHGEAILADISKALNISAKESVPSLENFGLEPVVDKTKTESKYQIIGTATSENIKKPYNIAKIVPKKACVRQMLNCGTIIFDISCDSEEVKLAKEYIDVLNTLLEKEVALNLMTLPQNNEGSQEGIPLFKRQLLLISTVMTWGLTKPLDPEVPDLPFVETDFRKRRPHPNYKEHYDCENLVINMSKKFKYHLSALVLTTGLTYGGREDVLYYWFQKAWECEPVLPIFGRGGNYIPILPVKDLANIVMQLVQDFPRKHYVLAVDPSQTKQRQIIKSIGKAIGSGVFKCIPVEDAFLIPEITQRIYDIMTVNLSMDPVYIVETLGISSEMQFDEFLPSLFKDFKITRALKPFKVLLYGPPFVGKTTIAKQLCANYGLVYVSAETITKDLLQELNQKYEQLKAGETAGLPTLKMTEEEETVSTEEPEDEQELMETLRTTIATLESNRRFTDEEIVEFLRQRLLLNDCLNRGYVLDGFPTTLLECGLLFNRADEVDETPDTEENPEAEDEFEEDIGLYKNVFKKILPDIVVSLEASDDYICTKVVSDAGKLSNLEEEAMLKRISEFRASDARDISPLNFFDDLDLHPLVIKVSDHKDYGMKCPYDSIAIRLGKPSSYSKIKALIEAKEKEEQLEQNSLRLIREAECAKLEKQMREAHEERMEYWTDLYAILRDEEEAALAVAAEPMRTYLIKYIFPTLTAGLLEIAKLRPADPVDYLAEYLFKLNPTGHMLEPGYNLIAEKLVDRIKILDDSLKDLDIQIEPLIQEEESNKNEEKIKINPMSNF